MDYAEYSGCSNWCPYILGGLPAIWNWTKEKEKSETQLPDVTLRFVYPKSPALVLMNPSNKVAKQIKWVVVLWNLDLPERTDPLPIPTSMFDFIRPHSEGGPLNLFNVPAITPLLKPGNRLIGSASVQCPDCLRGRTFIVSIIWGDSGWFTEVLDKSDGSIIAPPFFNREKIMEYATQLNALVPEKARRSIVGLSEKNGTTSPQ